MVPFLIVNHIIILWSNSLVQHFTNTHRSLKQAHHINYMYSCNRSINLKVVYEFDHVRLILHEWLRVLTLLSKGH